VSAADASAVAVAVVLVLAMVAMVLVIRRRGGPDARTSGNPDLVGADVVTGLMAEVRKWQAETAYWKEQAERLQRQLDERQDPATDQ
jgi:hypothetical protein